MELNETPKRMQIREKSGEDYLNGNDTNGLKRRRNVHVETEGNRKTNVMLFLAAVAVLLLVLAITLMRSGGDEKGLHISVLEKRLKQVEIQIAKIEDSIQKLAQVPIKTDEIAQMKTDVDTAVADQAAKIALLENELAALKAQRATASDATKQKAPEVKPALGQQPEKPQPVAESPAGAPAVKKTRKVAAKKKPVVTSEPANRMFHTVQAGETLYRISQRYRMSIEELKQANPSIQGNTIHTGQTLLIPVD